MSAQILQADVIILARLPANKRSFSYRVPDSFNLKPGHIVRVSFRKSLEFAVVIAVERRYAPRYTLLDVQDITHPEPLLTIQDIQDAIFFSRLYSVYAGMICKMMLPPLQPRALQKLVVQQTTKRSAGGTPSLHVVTSPEHLTNELELLTGGGLILTPRKVDAQEIAEFIDGTIFNSTGGAPHTREIWQALHNNPQSWIVGTRQAVWLPLHTCANIVIWNPWNEHHKSWEATPRYHVEDVLSVRLRKRLGALHYITHTPQISTVAYLQQSTLELSTTADKPEPIAARIHSLDDEVRNKNFSFITEPAKTLIAQATPQKKLLVLHNRKGFSRWVECIDCHHHFTCPECDASIRIQANGKMYCGTITHTVPQHQRCPKCDSTKFKLAAKGVDALAFELSKEFPDLRVAVLHAEHDAEFGTADCIVATDAAFSKVDFGLVGAVWIPYADRFLTQPWHAALEEGLQFFRDVAWQQSTNTPLLIQTFAPHHLLFRALTNYDALRTFYAKELQDRKAHKMPPFSTLVSFTYLDSSTTKTAHTALKQAFESTFTAGQYLIGPPLSVPRKNGTTETSFLCQIPTARWMHSIAEIAEQLGKHWRIDPNPHHE